MYRNHCSDEPPNARLCANYLEPNQLLSAFKLKISTNRWSKVPGRWPIGADFTVDTYTSRIYLLKGTIAKPAVYAKEVDCHGCNALENGIIAAMAEREQKLS